MADGRNGSLLSESKANFSVCDSDRLLLLVARFVATVTLQLLEHRRSCVLLLDKNKRFLRIHVRGGWRNENPGGAAGKVRRQSTSEILTRA